MTVSLVLGYIICQIAFLIPFTIGTIGDNICIIIWSIIIGFILGKTINYRKTDEILDKLKIGRTANSSLWNDIVDINKIMEAEITIDNITYDGKIHLIEEFSNSPHVVLADYSIDGNKNKKDNQIIILDTAKAQKVVIKYDRNSPMMEKIKFNE